MRGNTRPGPNFTGGSSLNKRLNIAWFRVSAKLNRHSTFTPTRAREYARNLRNLRRGLVQRGGVPCLKRRQRNYVPVA